MRQAHKPLIALVTTALNPASEYNILDLGCGSGYLLRSVRQNIPRCHLHGLDNDLARVCSARSLLATTNSTLIVGSMFDPVVLRQLGRQKLTFLMPGRLVEAGRPRSRELVRWLQDNSDFLLLYCYGDWCSRYESVISLSRSGGLVIGRIEHASQSSVLVKSLNCRFRE